MKNGQIKVWLSPLNGGSYTRLRLYAALPTALPVWELRHLAERMSFFSGYAVQCVLSAGLEEANWSEWWTDLLAGIPGRLLDVRFVPRHKKRSIGSGGR